MSVIPEELSQLLKQTRCAVLGTVNGVDPNVSLVRTLMSEDCCSVYFLTPRDSDKYKALQVQPRTALLFTDLNETTNGLNSASAVTAYGKAEEITGTARTRASDMLIANDPDLKVFIETVDSACMQVQINRYRYVQNLTNVIDLDIN